MRREKYTQGNTETTIKMMTENEITEVIIGCAIKVHKSLVPGLLESIKSIEALNDIHLAQILTFICDFQDVTLCFSAKTSVELRV